MCLTDDFVACRVPATSANPKLGFDSVSLAPGLWSEVSAYATVGPTAVVVKGESTGQVDGGEKNLIVKTLHLSLGRLGTPQVGIYIHCHSRISHSQGLGFPAAAIVAGFVLTRALTSEEKVLGPKDTLDIGTELEDHPDNIVPAILGGTTVARVEGSTADAPRFMPPVQTSSVAFIPDFEFTTGKARSALPELITHGDARYNISRATLFSALLPGAYEVPTGAALRKLSVDATGGRLHQKQRRTTVESSPAFVDWLRVGRMPAVVFGAGPTVLSLEKVSAGLKHDAGGAR